MGGQDKKFERVNQKRRTRVELLRAARELIENGNQNPSIGDVADHALISRATAYRYFSSSEEMIREAVLDGVADAIHVPAANEGDGAVEAAARLDKLVIQVFEMVVDNEGVFRALLATSATGQSNTRRGGRRLTWLRETLSPVEKDMTSKEFDRLVHSLSLLIGIEALVVTRDICELGNKDAEKMLRWMAETLLTAAISESIRS